MLKAFGRSGHSIFPISIHEKSMRQIFEEIEMVAPDFCYVQNFHVSDSDSPQRKDDLDYFFLQSKFPIAIWYLDNPEFQGDQFLWDRWQTTPYPRHCLFFVNDESFGSFFKERELTAIHLPIGADRDILQFRKNPHAGRWAAPLRFCGSPIVGASLADLSLESVRGVYEDAYFQKMCEVANQYAIPEMQCHRFLEAISPILSDFFRPYYNSPQDYRSGEIHFYKRVKELPECNMENVKLLRHCGRNLTEFYSWSQLTCYLMELLSQGLVVQGSPYWRGFFKNQVEEPRHLSWEELFASYREAKINFCFTKWTLPTAIHDRIFEILLASGFPLTDFRESLSSNFDKDEIAYYHDINEAKDLIDFYLKNETARLGLAERGFQRVLRSHTYDDRCRQLIDHCVNHWGL